MHVTLIFGLLLFLFLLFLFLAGANDNLRTTSLSQHLTPLHGNISSEYQHYDFNSIKENMNWVLAQPLTEFLSNAIGYLSNQTNLERLIQRLKTVFQLPHVRRRKNVRPVVLIPGDGGSQLEYRVKGNRSSRPEYCPKPSPNYTLLWLNMKLMMPNSLECWIMDFKLTYNITTRRTQDSPDVDIRVRQFGNTKPVEVVDENEFFPMKYFANLVDHLRRLGLAQGKTLSAASYDFRRGPSEQAGYYKELARLVEKSYFSGNRKPVLLVAHSMGAPLTLAFLQDRPLPWKKKYIAGFITLAGCWIGAVKALKVFAAGDDMGIFFLPRLAIREEQRSQSSLSFLIPQPEFWRDDPILVSTPERLYSVYDYASFFRDINYWDGYEMWLDSLPYLRFKDPPRVPVFCFYGVGIKTIKRLVYDEQRDFPDNPKLEYGNGDGTVNIRSLDACTIWKGMQPEPVVNMSFFGVDHMSILKHASTMKYIDELVDIDSYKEHEGPLLTF